MQYFEDLIANFNDIKKRKFKLTEISDPLEQQNIFTPGQEVDPIQITFQSNYKNILPQYRLDQMIYDQFFMKFQMLMLHYAGKTEDGVLNGQVFDLSQEEFFIDAIQNQLRVFLTFLGREKVSTYEKELLKSSFSFIGENYFCISLYGSDDLSFVFKDENNVLRSIFNSLSEKYKIQFNSYDLKKVLNFYSNNFFKNLSVGTELTTSKIVSLYQGIMQNFLMGSPIHISDLFYVDLIQLIGSKYSIDLITGYSEGLLSLKNRLGASTILNDPSYPGRFIAQIGNEKVLENYFPPKEIEDFNLFEQAETNSVVRFKNSTYLDLDKVSLGSKTYFSFYSFLKGNFTTVEDVQSNLVVRNLLNIDPTILNRLVGTINDFCDSINRIFYLPFKASIHKDDGTTIIEYPLKDIIRNVLLTMKKTCTYSEIYENTYKSKVISLLERIMEQKDLSPALENFIRSKLCEVLFIAKLAETITKDKFSGKFLICLLIIFLSGSADQGELTAISTVLGKDFVLFRTNDLINSIIKPLVKGDPSVTLEVVDNQIIVRTFNTSVHINLSISDLMYLKFSLYVPKTTIEKYNRTKTSTFYPIGLGKEKKKTEQKKKRNLPDTSKTADSEIQ